MTIRYVDPPSGWKYGFPKVLPIAYYTDALHWVLTNGYPQAEKDSYGEHFYLRFWDEGTPEAEINTESEKR